MTNLTSRISIFPCPREDSGGGYPDSFTLRRLGPGEILLAEDLTGQGHKSQAVDGQPRSCLFVPIDDDETVS